MFQIKIYSPLCLSLLLLAGCAAAPEQPLPAAALVVEQPDPDPVGEVVAEPAAEVAPLPNPDDLLGLEPKGIQELLGPVSLKRWEGTAQVMQFKGGQCVMDIYFFENQPGGAFEAAYLSARNLSGADVDTASCLTSLLPE